MPEEIRITEAEYRRVHPDFRGVWSTERYDIPGWEAMRDRHMGKRTLMRHGALYIEGMGLTIVPDWSH